VQKGCRPEGMVYKRLRSHIKNYKVSINPRRDGVFQQAAKGPAS
jgi:hypothetical protein